MARYGDIVAVALPRSVEAVVAVWAIQKAGAAVLFAEGLSFGDILAAGATFGIAKEPAASSVRWLVPADPQVQADLTARPAHPVTYTDRVRPLTESDPAFVYRNASGTWATLTQAEALDRATTLRTENEIDYESTTFTTATIGLPAVDEFLTSSTAACPLRPPHRGPERRPRRGRSKPLVHHRGRLDRSGPRRGPHHQRLTVTRR